MPSRKTKVAALSVGRGLSGLIGMAVAMLMARLLSKEDVAAYRQTLLAYATVGPLLSMGIGQGMYYFLPGEEVRLRGRVVDGLSITALMGIVFAIGLAFGGNDYLALRFSNPKVAKMLLWMIPYAVVTTPARLASSVLVVRDYVNLSAVFSVVQQFVIGISTAVPLLLWQTAETALIGNIVASVFMGAAAIVLMIRATPNDSFAPSASGVAQLISFTIPLALASMFGAISLQLDKLIVSLMCSPREFAEYAFGAIELPIIGVVTGAVTSIALTDMRSLVVSGNKREALTLFHQIAEKTSLIILPALGFFLLTADTLMYYLYSDGYSGSAGPFRVYLLLLPIRTVVFGSIIIALGKNNFILFRSMAGLAFNVVLSVLLVWKVGAWGAAVATVVSVYVVSLPANVYVISQEMNVRWFAVLPFRSMGAVVLMLSPLFVLSVFIVAFVQNVHIEFVLVLSLFVGFLSIYWNGRLYSFRKLASRIL